MSAASTSRAYSIKQLQNVLGPEKTHNFAEYQHFNYKVYHGILYT